MTTSQSLRALGVNATRALDASDAIEVGECLPGIGSLSLAALGVLIFGGFRVQGGLGLRAYIRALMIR